MMTDPIADMLARIRNANRAMHERATMPSSRLKVQIARILKEEGYIKDFQVVEGESFDTLVIDLKFGRNRERVEMPTSRLKEQIARLLKEEGYITDFRVEKGEAFDTLVIQLKYGRRRERVITDLKRVSKPGRRVYARKDRLPRVLGGMGISILSTSAGVVTSRTAQEKGMGGEVICFVW